MITLLFRWCKKRKAKRDEHNRFCREMMQRTEALYYSSTTHRSNVPSAATNNLPETTTNQGVTVRMATTEPAGYTPVSTNSGVTSHTTTDQNTSLTPSEPSAPPTAPSETDPPYGHSPALTETHSTGEIGQGSVEHDVNSVPPVGFDYQEAYHSPPNPPPVGMPGVPQPEFEAPPSYAPPSYDELFKS